MMFNFDFSIDLMEQGGRGGQESQRTPQKCLRDKLKSGVITLPNIFERKPYFGMKLALVKTKLFANFLFWLLIF